VSLASDSDVICQIAASLLRCYLSYKRPTENAHRITPVVGRLVLGAAILMALALISGCGGGSDSAESSDTTSAAERHNAAILGEAEGDAQIESAIKEELDYKLAPYYDAGVEGTFVTPNGDSCYIGEIYLGEELDLYREDKNTLLSPNGEVGVSVGTFQGTPYAPCLKAAVEALGWDQVEGHAAPQSSRPLTKAEFINRADAICRKGNDEVDRIFSEDQTYGDEAASDSEARPGYVRRIEEHEAFEPPASISRLFDEYVSLLNEQVDIQDEAQAAAATIESQTSTGGTEGLKQARKDFKKARAETAANYERRERIARKIGLSHCAPTE
jgi:hypothetical protein